MNPAAKELWADYYLFVQSCNMRDAAILAPMLGLGATQIELACRCADAGLQHWAQWVEDLPTVHDLASARAVVHALTRLPDQFVGSEFERTVRWYAEGKP